MRQGQHWILIEPSEAVLDVENEFESSIFHGSVWLSRGADAWGAIRISPFATEQSNTNDEVPGLIAKEPLKLKRSAHVQAHLSCPGQFLVSGDMVRRLSHFGPIVCREVDILREIDTTMEYASSKQGRDWWEQWRRKQYEASPYTEHDVFDALPTGQRSGSFPVYELVVPFVLGPAEDLLGDVECAEFVSRCTCVLLEQGALLMPQPVWKGVEDLVDPNRFVAEQL